MSKYILGLILVLITPKNSIGQPLHFFEGIHNLYDILNPAARDNNFLIYNDWGEESSFKSPPSFDFYSKVQWLSIEGAPITTGIKGNFSNGNKFLWGGSILYDKIGFFSNFQGSGKVALNIPALIPSLSNKNLSLSLGVGLLGGINDRINENVLSSSFIQPGDPLDFNQITSNYIGGSAGFYGHFSWQRIKLVYGGGIIKPVSQFSILTSYQFANLGLIFKLKNKESNKSSLEVLVQKIRTHPFIITNYNIRYHHDLDEYSLNGISLASIGLGYRQNAIQIEFFGFLNDAKWRLGFILDLFRPTFKNTTSTILSFECQASYYLFK